ncbi:MAG: tRNA uridine(34) 5-carboxymethylaminomethyl modification radical SAM/GNAT enzyme Elp3, partial [archaeon]
MNKTSNKLFFEELINKIHNNNISSAKELNLLKIKLAKKYKINKVVKNSQIIGFADKETREKLINLLNIKPIRDISGVNVVALFTKPHNCPHGRCVYCPGGLKSEFGDTPQSYTGFEPAALRAIRNNYDPYFQVFNRLEHYVINGKIPDKLELIFMGGTFPVLDKNYRDNFVYYVYKAINDFSEEFLYLDENNKKQVDFKKFNIFFETDKDLNSKEREKNILEKFEQLKYNNNNDSCDNYKDEIKKVQYALIRPIGLTIETRPDETLKKSCLEMLNYGCTRFEIGVQSLNDEVLKKNNRGHGLKEIKESFEILKDMCFKINVHMMIGLAFSDIAKDKKSLIDLFKDRSFRPDMIKIYPCLVVRGTKLYDMYKLGQYTPIKTQKASEIISKSFKYFPRYVRVMRVQRDIPTQNVVAGVLNSNLRDYVDAKLKNEN